MAKTKAQMLEIAENLRKRDQMRREMDQGEIISETSEEDGTDEVESWNPSERTNEVTFTRRLLEGSLAEAVRKRLGVSSDEQVFITERTEHYDLSEYTSDTDHRHIIECAGHRKEFDHAIPIWNFDALLRWLDGEEN